MAEDYAPAPPVAGAFPGGPAPSDPLLAGLLEAARRGAGLVLRASPQRTVLRLEFRGRRWLLKICHPRRRAERLRRLFSPAPALREHRNWSALAGRIPGGLPGPARSEQTAPGFGLFARPWLPHPAADERILHEAQAIGAGLAALHACGWTDPDLLPGDLLLTPDGLVPADLGQAVLVPGGASWLARRRDLLRFLAALPAQVAERCAPALAGGYAGAGSGRPDCAALLRDATDERRRALWRQSRRCLRTNRDFEAGGGTLRRRTARSGPWRAGEALAAGRRSRVTRHGSQVLKTYRRPPWRTLLPGPGRRAFRRLYLLELHALDAARPLAWRRARGGEVLATGLVEGRPAGPQDAAGVARWLARLHAAGLGLRDAKLANFRVDRGGRVGLVDPDGLRLRAARPARDLGRLLAEVGPESPEEAQAVATYCGDGPARPEGFLARARASARRYRRILARKAGSGAAGGPVPWRGRGARRR